MAEFVPNILDLFVYFSQAKYSVRDLCQILLKENQERQWKVTPALNKVIAVLLFPQGPDLLHLMHIDECVSLVRPINNALLIWNWAVTNLSQIQIQNAHLL